MREIIAGADSAIEIGRLGENQYTRVAFDISPYMAQYPNATYRLLNRRPNDALAYPVADMEVVGTNLYWNVSSADLTQKGVGSCEIVVLDGETVVKSIIFMTLIREALDDSGSAPPPWDSWLTQFEQYAEEAQESAQAAADSAETAMQYNTRVNISGTALVITSNS